MTISYRNLRHFNSSVLQAIESHQLNGSIDKLNILTNHVDKGFIRLVASTVRPYRFNSKAYGLALSFDLGHTKINIFEGPTFRNSSFFFKIETNPSHFSSGGEYWDFLSGVLGREGLKENIVKRMDCALLCPSRLLPVDLFFQTIRFAGKQRVSRFRDSRIRYRRAVCSGFSLGRSPHRVTCYDVDMERWKDRELYKKLKEKDELQPVDRTKFEIQIGNFKYAPMISCYGDFLKLGLVDPFGKTQFLNPFAVKFSASKKMDLKIENLRVLAFAHSYHNARAILNRKNKKFERVEAYIPNLMVSDPPVSLIGILRDAYFRDVNAWLIKK